MLKYRNSEDLSGQIKYVKEELRSIPSKGINYSVLKYLSDGNVLPENKNQILFNYLGQLDNREANDFLELADDIEIEGTDKRNRRTHLLDMTCKVLNSRMIIDSPVYGTSCF